MDAPQTAALRPAEAEQLQRDSKRATPAKYLSSLGPIRVDGLGVATVRPHRANHEDSCDVGLYIASEVAKAPDFTIYARFRQIEAVPPAAGRVCVSGVSRIPDWQIHLYVKILHAGIDQFGA